MKIIKKIVNFVTVKLHLLFNVQKGNGILKYSSDNTNILFRML